ncbi:alpha/beta hydrolase family protein [Chitinophaga varians]|uniref:alpha/beta hydrolase family protein n=1 Tax=Chitinophaga varians TaxID=2202339 RepID=UPI00165F2450|nr:alpha/beta fold hydrolase [Chitinophaga varians]MBC9909561.1 alpha/beta hydrolase [Chitinophaga varians]
MKTHLLSLLTVFLISGAATAQQTESFSNCRNGAYALSDGSQLVISPSVDKDLRYRRLDGTTGRLFLQADSSYLSGPGWANARNPNIFARFGGCANDSLIFQQDGKTFTGKRIPFPVIPMHIPVKGATLYGELFLPAGRKPKAVVILHYGSGGESAVYNNYKQYILPLGDVAVFVYDKRGTGRSTGQLSANFELLAADMVATVKAVKAQAVVKGVPVGLMGESQGGWIVPLTATLTPVDFVIAAYSLLIPPREENRQEVLHDLQNGHYNKEAIATAMQVVAATDEVLRTGLNGGLAALDSVKAKYKQEPWYASLQGDYTGPILNASRAQLDSLKQIFPTDIPLDYDPLPAFRRVNVPMLWIIAGKDTEAPNGGTIAVLKEATATRKNIDVVIFPNADHGIIDVQDSPQGPILLRQSAGYFELLRDWILTRQVKKRYGDGLSISNYE